MIPAPLSPYAVSKLAGEYYCRVFYHLFGLETVCLRYFNVFGPRQDPTSQYAAVVPKFVSALLRGEAPQIYGDGEQTRDFTYIENVIDANLAGTEAADCAGGVFNIACGKRITVNRLAELLAEHLGVSIPGFHLDRRAGDVRHSLADIGAARRALLYEARIGVEEGLSRYCEMARKDKN
jgi:nucleoside-diphosphate-sugar epimerase